MKLLSISLELFQASKRAVNRGLISWNFESHYIRVSAILQRFREILRFVNEPVSPILVGGERGLQQVKEEIFCRSFLIGRYRSCSGFW